MAPRHIRPISEMQMTALTTARLLAYKRRLMGLEDAVEDSDWEAEKLMALDRDLVYFKSDSRWYELHRDLKAVLGRREHVGG